VVWKTCLQLPHGSIASVLPPWLHFEPLKLLNFEFNTDPDVDPTFHSHADADMSPASQNNAGPDPLHWMNLKQK
jgi:hypothetical protein